MIIFEKIRWKNFLSTGNQFTEVSLNDTTTTLIIGTNGAGKSTILDALCFSLFNKSFRKINKNQLINTTNEKTCIVEVEFLIGVKKYKVVRGIKPGIFEIWINDELQNQFSSSVDQQKYLEQNVLKLNYKSFTQIVILGSSNFVPFMQLNPASRREVIEDLLDIRIFSHMNIITKERIKSSRDQISQLKNDLKNIEDKVSMQNRFIKELEDRSQNDVQAKNNEIQKLLSQENKLTNVNVTLNKEVGELQENLNSLSGFKEKLSEYADIKSKISQKITIVCKEHKFFNKNTVCPTCEQNIEEEFRLNKIEDSKTKAQELQSGLEKLETVIESEMARESKFKKISGDITNNLNEISKNNNTISSLQKQVRQLDSEIQRIASRDENGNIEYEKLGELNVEGERILLDLNKEIDYKSNLENIHYLLKDDGVKTKIVKKYLPIINQQINRYLQLMDFYINFKLDQEFNETVESPIHEDFSYSSFSEGEKMRIDLALLFTWREVAKLKNSSSTNLLIMDEVFDSSLDGYGTDEFMKIIRYVVQKSNIFVISHKNELYDKFDSVLKFNKVKGFSSMVKTV